MADALEFCARNGLPEFEGCEATVKFLRTFNRLFDVMNSRNLQSSGYKHPLNGKNFKEICMQLKKDGDYLKNLECPNKGIKIVDSSRKNGFRGFLILIVNTEHGRLQ